VPFGLAPPKKSFKKKGNFLAKRQNLGVACPSTEVSGGLHNIAIVIADDKTDLQEVLDQREIRRAI
jgi:hypothetical protein